MHKKEWLMIQKKIAETVKESDADPVAAAAKLLELKKEAEGFADGASPEFYDAAAMISEAMGDVWRKAKKPAEAEKAYLEMIQYAVKVYEMDKEKFDYRLGFSQYKRASFYRAMIQCTELKPTPKELDEKQKKIFEATEGLYKNAIACTMEHAKKGILRYVDLHALVLSELVILYASVGNYEKAVLCGKDEIRLDKAIYEKMDDKAHSFRLAKRMNVLAKVYTLKKDVQSAMEMLEDAVFVLEEHEEEEPITFGVMLARNYLALGGCYSQIEEEVPNAEATYRKGLKRMLEVNKKADNKLINEVIMARKIVEDYYKGTRSE